MKLPLKTLIVEDEKDVADVLIKRLEMYHSDTIDTKNLDVAYTFESAMAFLGKTEYALSILDISINGDRIFNLFKKIDTRNLGIVAYLTATTDYTSEELEMINPHFFIKKPTNKFDLGDFFDSLKIYLSQLKDVEAFPSHYLFRDGRDNYIALADEHIYYLEAEGNYSTIYYIKNKLPGKISLRGTLKDLKEKKFISNIYWRIERSFMVNSEKVDKYGRPDGDTGDVIFNDNIVFDVPSSQRIKYSVKFLNNYMKNKH